MSVSDIEAVKAAYSLIGVIVAFATGFAAMAVIIVLLSH